MIWIAAQNNKEVDDESDSEEDDDDYDDENEIEINSGTDLRDNKIITEEIDSLNDRIINRKYLHGQLDDALSESTHGNGFVNW